MRMSNSKESVASALGNSEDVSFTSPSSQFDISRSPKHRKKMRTYSVGHGNKVITLPPSLMPMPAAAVLLLGDTR
jgi:hypothetical protein